MNDLIMNNDKGDRTMIRKAETLKSLDELNLPARTRTYLKKSGDSLDELIKYGRELAIFSDNLKPYPKYRIELVSALDEAGFIRHDLSLTNRVVDLYIWVDEHPLWSNSKADERPRDWLFDNENYETIEAVTDEQVRSIIEVISDVLTPKERAIVISHFGLEGTKVRFDQISEMLNLPRERILHMLRIAVEKLRSATKRYYADCYHPLPPLYGFFEPVQVEPGTIETLRLSVRCYNCLKRAGINTIADIINLSKDQWPQVRNLSRRDLEEIERAVRAVESCEDFSILS